MLEDIKIYPQPADTEMSFSYKANAGDSISLYFYNAAGMLVAKDFETASFSGVNTIMFKVKRFAPGIFYYICRIKDQSGNETIYKGKFIIAR